MDVVPVLVELPSLVKSTALAGDRVGAVAHQRHEPGGQYPQADKAEYKTDHASRPSRAPRERPFDYAGAPPRVQSRPRAASGAIAGAAVRGPGPEPRPECRRPPPARPTLSLEKRPAAPKERPSGEVAEWLKAHAWKACVRESVPWVRIPPSPPGRLGSTFSAGLRTPQRSPITAGLRAQTSGLRWLAQIQNSLSPPFFSKPQDSADLVRIS